MNFPSKVIEWIKNICFPPSCYICNTFTDSNGLCPNCWKNIKWISDPRCEICGIPFSLSLQKVCVACMKKTPYFDEAISVFVYDKFSKPMVLQFKNGDCTYMAHQFAVWMYRAAEKRLLDMDMIIPIPISLVKRLKRKYNQSELLAMEIAELSNIEYAPLILNKIKSTKPQEGLSRIARERNLLGSFGVSPKYVSLIKDRNIVLVDDVMTTGATVNECAKVLKKHGARRVIVITIARTTMDERDATYYELI